MTKQWISAQDVDRYFKRPKKGSPTIRCLKCKYQKIVEHKELTKKVSMNPMKIAEIVVIDQKKEAQLNSFRPFVWSVKHAETPKAKLGLSKRQTKLSIQQLPFLDAQNVKPREENLDKPNNAFVRYERFQIGCRIWFHRINGSNSTSD